MVSAVDTILLQQVLACISSSIAQISRCFPEFADLWQRESCIIDIFKFPADIQFRHVYYVFAIVFALDTFAPNFFPRLSSTDPVPPPRRLSPFRTAPHYTLISSAKVLRFWCFHPVQIMMANRKWLKADPGWWPTSTAKGSHVRAALTVHVLHQSDCPSVSLPVAISFGSDHFRFRLFPVQIISGSLNFRFRPLPVPTTSGSDHFRFRSLPVPTISGSDHFRFRPFPVSTISGSDHFR